jgi:hypothetical protein
MIRITGGLDREVSLGFDPPADAMPTVTITLGDQEKADHEAGHFVLGHLFDFPWVEYYVTIEYGKALKTGHPTGGGVGVDFKGPPDPDEYGVYSMAGMAAARKGIRLRYGTHAVRHCEEWIQAGGQGDRDGLEFVPGTSKEWRPYMRRAHGILDRCWPLVEVLSSEILKERTLFHDEARIIVNAVLQKSPILFDYLKVYRKLRRTIDASGIPKDFLEAQPDFKWPETVMDFRLREGFPDISKFDDWRREKMGIAKPPPDPPVSIAREIARALYDESKRRLKDKVRSFLRW